MKHGYSCVVPGCTSKSYQDSHLSFYCLPLHYTLQRKWFPNIGKKRLPKNSSFMSFEHGKYKRKNKIPTLNLSKPVVHINHLAWKSPTQRQPYTEGSKNVLVSVNTDGNWDESTGT